MEQNVRSFISMLLDRSKHSNNTNEEAKMWVNMLTSGNGVDKSTLEAVFEKIIQRMKTVQDGKKDEVVNDIMKFILGSYNNSTPSSTPPVTNLSSTTSLTNGQTNPNILPVTNTQSAPTRHVANARSSSTTPTSNMNKVKDDVVNYISEKLEAADKSLILDKTVLDNYAKSCGLQLDAKMLNDVKGHIEGHFGNKGLTIIMKGSTIQFIKA
ncbi:Hypothetical protein ORPV_9 [Orpheovirus IHUMI-LCC2]|uniref:Uncharacterized protein n=1 Tax=Orpheovirus IHUMI-LCC2 TaxID=2023057 RepID=A0A2I2L315_9VIRU|nr:Hypothetical protein ORPV_9 [Orpheovirus IHUMI-LCC2]SNW61913.1 Hypothetical protein ORPV_9 [Orpheovirus IHUMI-LCC2]